jgi:hypothetical protein
MGSARRRESGAEIEKSKLGRQRRRSTGRMNRTKEEEEAMLERREKRRQESIAIEKVRWRTTSISHSGNAISELGSILPPSSLPLKLGHFFLYVGTQRKKSEGYQGKTAEGSRCSRTRMCEPKRRLRRLLGGNLRRFPKLKIELALHAH